MSTKLICLANSFKHGGRCIAGIELDAQNNPKLINGKPKWIRPVCDTEHGEIPNAIALPFKLLDIIELETIAARPNGYQAENISFEENSIRVSGTFQRNGLSNICDGRYFIFGNTGKAIAEEDIQFLTHSLILINVHQFQVTEKIYDDRPQHSQVRLSFAYNGARYDFPITDPVFLQRYTADHHLLKNVSELFLCCSLGIVWKDWYYKLIAGVIF
jgi:hypothetical protein